MEIKRKIDFTSIHYNNFQRLKSKLNIDSAFKSEWNEDKGWYNKKYNEFDEEFKNIFNPNDLTEFVYNRIKKFFDDNIMLKEEKLLLIENLYLEVDNLGQRTIDFNKQLGVTEDDFNERKEKLINKNKETPKTALEKLIFKFENEYFENNDLKKEIEQSKIIEKIIIEVRGKLKERLEELYRLIKSNRTELRPQKYTLPELSAFQIRKLIDVFKEKGVFCYSEISDEHLTEIIGELTGYKGEQLRQKKSKLMKQQKGKLKTKDEYDKIINCLNKVIDKLTKEKDELK